MKSAQELNSAYEALGIEKGVTLEQVRQAFYKKARELHPDKNLNTDTAEQMKQVNQAYQLLCEHLLDKNTFDWREFTVPAPNKKPDQVYKMGDWSMQIREREILIYHPDLQGCKDNISIFLRPAELFIALPINFNEYRKNRIKRNLLSIETIYNTFSENDVEFFCSLPKDRIKQALILMNVFKIYQVPQDFMKPIEEKLSLELGNRTIPHRSTRMHAFFAMKEDNRKEMVFEGWTLQFTQAHLFLNHSKWTKTAQLTFFHIFKNHFYITLPINDNKETQEYFQTKLLPLLQEPPIVGDLFECVISLHKNQNIEKIIEMIVEYYELPEAVIAELYAYTAIEEQKSLIL